MDAFYGEIRAFPYQFVPQGWLECDGQTYPVQSYQALYAVIGNIYGGTSPTTFKVPDLRGQAALGSAGYNKPTLPLNQKTGHATVTLTQSQLPAHNHNLQSQGSTNRLAAPSNAAVMLFPRYTSPVDSKFYNLRPYVPSTASPTKVAMASTTLAPVGTGLPHSNLSPFVVFRYCICATDATFPVSD